jgi:CO dehydrogenase maturation factor
VRIAFVGKGGSGKTTLAALFARHLAAQGRTVLAIDADINQHLAVTLGLDEHAAAGVPSLAAHADRLKAHLRGRNQRIGSAASMVKTTPPGRGSRLVGLAEADPLLASLERRVSGVRLLATGPFEEADLGVACFHSKVGAAELLLGHLLDGAGEYVVVDMTAGADAFASGLFTRFDLTVLVAEPTVKAVSVWRQYREHAGQWDVQLRVVGNKLAGPDELAWLAGQVGRDLLTHLGQSAWVRAAERGQQRPLAALEPANQAALATIQDLLDASERDWDRMQRQAAEFHRRNADAWASARAGEDLTAQIDPDFRLADAATQTQEVARVP